MTFDPLTSAHPLQACHLKGHIIRSTVVLFLSVMVNHDRSYALGSIGRSQPFVKFEGLVTKKPYDIWDRY